MKITHYCNSFMVVEMGGTRLGCDPWVGISSYGGWMTYPITKGGDKILKDIDLTHLYISHIHADHMGGTNLFSDNMLMVLDKHIPVYIKQFEQKHLFKRLKSLGFENIIELTPWEASTISLETEITIFPCDTSNLDSLKDDINYDIDTSILIRSLMDDSLFYNNVDSPITFNGMRKIKEYSKIQGKIGNIDVACIAVGAASEYPQCFPYIDRQQEKKRIIDVSLNTFSSQLKILENTYFFPAGGTYIIPGKYSALNDYVAQPSFDQLKSVVESTNTCKNIFGLEGGNSIKKEGENWSFSEGKINKFDSKKIAIQTNKNFVYEYKKLPDIDDNILQKMFFNAKQNYLEKLKEINIKITWKVTFNLYEDLQLDDQAVINNRDHILKTYTLCSNDDKEAKYVLHCHLDRQLFFGVLNRDCVWNLVLSGQIVIFERIPNIFNPTIVFSLNYLVADNETILKIK